VSSVLHRVAAAALLALVALVPACGPNGEAGPDVVQEQAAGVSAGDHDGHGAQGSEPDPHAGHTMAADGHADHEGTAGPVAEHADHSPATRAVVQHGDHAATASGRSEEHAAHRPAVTGGRVGADGEHAGHGVTAPAGPAAHAMPMGGTDTATVARDDAGHARLMELVRGLLADSVVQRRVQTVAELRRLWADSAVRNHFQEREHQH
jgi:hypothetical protein